MLMNPRRPGERWLNTEITEYLKRESLPSIELWTVPADDVLRRIAGARLQAVTRTANYNPFKPFTYVPSSHPNNPISEAEQREGLTAWLESACRRFGYKILEIDRLSFRHDFQHNELTLMERGNDFWVAPNGSYSSPVYIDTHEGSIALYEANM